MDTLYYSNYCKHSQRVLQFLVKGNLTGKINFLCIDNRERGDDSQMYIILEDGKRVIMPPNVQSVPSLLLVRQGYRVILGDDIIAHYHIDANLETKKKQSNQIIEPIGTSLMISSGGMNIVSEPYTSFNLTSEELSAKGNSGRRNMYNYVSANDEVISIQTPPDTYHPDKLDKDVTIDTLQQKRFDDIDKGKQPTMSI